MTTTQAGSNENRQEQTLSGMAARFIQVLLAGAALACALVLIRVRAIGGRDMAAAVEHERPGRTFTIRLEQAEMLMQAGCIEAGTY